MIILSCDVVDLRHVVLHDLGQLVIEAVVGLPELEVDVGILNRVAQRGMIGIQGGFPERAHRAPVQDFPKRSVWDGPDFLDLVGGAESVEEMQEGNAALDRRQMGHAGQIHDLLHTAGGQHGKAGLAAVHHVAVVAEDGHGVCAHRAGGHMNDRRLPGAADAVHDRDHQHQALRGGKGGGQGAGLQRAVNGTDGSCLRLHLHQIDRLGKQIFAPVSRPLIGLFRHRRGGCNRINGCNFRKGIRHIRRRLVAVCYHKVLFAHIVTLLFCCSVQLSTTFILSFFTSRNNIFCFVLLDKQKRSHNGHTTEFSGESFPQTV